MKYRMCALDTNTADRNGCHGRECVFQAMVLPASEIAAAK
jgi:hypothetical protein